MAFVSTISSSEGRAFSIGGPLKAEVHTYVVGTGITSGTITAKNLHQIYHVIIDGVVSTAAATFSGKTATIAIADPAATVYGTLILLGV